MSESVDDGYISDEDGAGMEIFRRILGTGSGFFAEIPDDAILKVPTPPCTADVVRALEVLSSDETRERYGQRCREYGREAFSRDRYAKEFLDFLEFVYQRTK